LAAWISIANRWRVDSNRAKTPVARSRASSHRVFADANAVVVEEAALFWSTAMSTSVDSSAMVEARVSRSGWRSDPNTGWKRQLRSDFETSAEPDCGDNDFIVTRGTGWGGNINDRLESGGSLTWLNESRPHVERCLNQVNSRFGPQMVSSQDKLDCCAQVWGGFWPRSGAWRTRTSRDWRRLESSAFQMPCAIILGVTSCERLDGKSWPRTELRVLLKIGKIGQIA
jgi:hypothetical protein